jgi:septin 6/8/11
MDVLQIMSELVANGVQIYQFPTDDETVAETNSSMNVRVFLCVCVCVKSLCLMLTINR